jgi:peroxiredoxin
MMRFWRILTAGYLVLFSNACVINVGQPTLSSPDIVLPRERIDAPSFTLETLSGENISLKHLKGQNVLIHFWATWCYSCREELPSLERLHQEYKSKNLTVLSVCADRSNIGGIEKASKRAGVTFPTLLDPDGTVRNQYEISAFPTTYLIGPDGKFLSRHIGAVDWDSEQYRTYVKKVTESKTLY